MQTDHQFPKNQSKDPYSVPFDTVMEAWFWFIQAQQARNDGARFTAGLSLTPRPCEPTDILKVLDRLYRQRRLLRDHLLVLRHYGRRQLPPDPNRSKEMLANKLWLEALERIEPILIRKGIVKNTANVTSKPNKFWSCNAKVHNSSQGKNTPHLGAM